MYADDILLLTASVCQMQELINICVNELQQIEFSVNPNKTTWIRIGNRYGFKCSTLNVNNVPIDYVKETKFLGTVILTAAKFKISLNRNKTSFFIGVNKLLSKLGCSDTAVVLALMNSHCVSALLYNLEACDLTKTELNSLNFVVTRALMNIFKTWCNKNILYCMFCSGQLPVDLSILIRKHKFLEKMSQKQDVLTDTFKSIVIQDKLKNEKIWSDMGGLHSCKLDALGIFQRQIEL